MQRRQSDLNCVVVLTRVFQSESGGRELRVYAANDYD